MTRQDVLLKITEILGEITEQDDLRLTEVTTADQVKDWDSVNHVRLLLGLESELGIRFETAEVGDLKDVGALIDVIRTKAGQD